VTAVTSKRERLIASESAGGVVLLAAAVVALAWANSPWSESYFAVWETHVSLGVGSVAIDLDLQHWVNDLLMALFFFMVGVEIKYELVVGALRNRRAAALPALVAVGGVALLAAIFVLIVGAGGEAARGWAIPAATDIAFAVGVLALLGDRVPSGVRVFLLTVAIVDDVIAIAIIAVFYAEGVAAGWLAVALLGLLATYGLRRVGVWRAWAYVPIAALVWVALYESGVHATLAGVALGLLVPVRPFHGHDVHAQLERRLGPVSAFVVLPLFALANAGIDLRGGLLGDALSSDLAWAIVAGLVLGKLLGISGAALLALRLRIGVLPDGMEPRHLLGVGALAGIGFTVSLFIADLAYSDELLTSTAKVGIFIASLTSGILGALVLARTRSASD
jgi:Na+:H+ antiporter, NhaA family